MCGYYIYSPIKQHFPVFVGHTKSFVPALLSMTLCMFGSGFHNGAILVNPQDIAPKHSGSVFGIINAAGALPGTNLFPLFYRVNFVLCDCCNVHNSCNVC